MKVTFLGTCANQTDTHEGVSISIETDNNFLIDTGPGIVRQILRSGRKCIDFSNVFITHCHGDHTLGFPYFIWNHFYESLEGYEGPQIINIYTFTKLYNDLMQMLNSCYKVDSFPFKIVLHEVSEVSISEFIIGKTLVKTIPVNHSTQTFGLRIEYNRRTISYSSDTLLSDEFCLFAKESDLLIHEGFATQELYDLSRKVKHGLGKDAGECAEKSNSKSLALVHFYPSYVNRLHLIVKEAKEYYDGHVFYPEELSTYDI